ncbi:tripartite tricarboxylate transporter substrate binding protein [soil metagenome]
MNFRLFAARLWFAVLTCAASAAPAHADYPDRAIHLIVPSTPGGSSDPMARLLAEEFTNRLGQPVVVENRPGANGNVGAASAAHAKPDGYTLLFSWAGTLVSAVTMYQAKPFDPRRDFDHIALISTLPNVIVVSNELPVKTLAELTAYAKAHPDELNFGSLGSGSSYHMAGELYKKLAGIQMLHVPYASPAAVGTDLISNRLQVSFPGVLAFSSLIKDGRMRAIAVMADRRSPIMPDVPTTHELGMPKLEAATWFGLLSPKGTPKPITDRLNKTVNDMVSDPAFLKRLAEMGYTPLGGTGAQFTSFMNEEIVKWDEIVKFSGAKID